VFQRGLVLLHRLWPLALFQLEELIDRVLDRSLPAFSVSLNSDTVRPFAAASEAIFTPSELEFAASTVGKG
jgi:hypothetical protein